MEHNNNLESGENFFSLVFGIVTEILIKRKMESLIVADSMLYSEHCEFKGLPTSNSSSKFSRGRNHNGRRDFDRT